MKIIFATAHFGFLRNFESAIRHLGKRGHQIVLTSDRGEKMGGDTIATRLRAELPEIEVREGPKAKEYRWHALQRAVRLCLDYLRYLDPWFDEAPKLRERAASQVPGWIVSFSALPLVRSRAGIGLLRRLLQGVDRAMPTNPAVRAFLEREAPDLVLITPLLYFGSSQVDMVRAARSRGIKTVLGVGSWDHLTTKGLIHEVPDRLIVWNRAQQDEAVKLHGIARARVLVTGAPAYDHWFGRGPSRERESFCAEVGLSAERPYFLYLCSSIFIAPDEHVFIRRWLDSIRAVHDELLSGAGLLIRPHPQNAAQLENLELSGFDNVAIFPRAGANPVDSKSRDDYFDSMFHSRAVVGLNTSAMIEAGIVGRPVYTVLGHEFAGTQRGTLHFQHLVSVNGGLVHSAANLDAHVEQLCGELSDSSDRTQKSRRFIEAFIRPRGRDLSAGAVFADEIEAFAASAEVSAASSTPIWAPFARPLLLPFAMAARSTLNARKRRSNGKA